MEEILIKTEEKMEKAIENMLKRFSNIRAGRANTSILDPILVKYYDMDTPLIQLATISVPEARTIAIKPFDKKCLSDIERAIYEANLGLTPNNNGEMITLNFPSLTEERRKELVKEVKVFGEDAKIVLRNIRQDSNNEIKKSDLVEDEEKTSLEEIQKLITEFNKKIEDEVKIKENELMTI